MREFEFLEPATLEDASRLLAQHGENARAYAGGTALILALRQRLVSPTHVVSLARLEALRGITFDAKTGLRIGALTRHAELAKSDLVARHVPMLASMAAHLANPQVRNQGTLGGNLCYADPATDPPTCLLALDAEIEIASARGSRRLSISDFFVDYYTTALEPDEIVVAVHVPAPAVGFAGAYTRHLRTAAEHRPLVNVAVTGRRNGNRLSDVRVAVGASTPIPARVPRAEEVLGGGDITPGRIAEAATAASEDIFAVSDGRGDEAYRRAMVRVVARRTMHTLCGLPQE